MPLDSLSYNPQFFLEASQNNDSLLDGIIYSLIILFLLSVITEKFGTMIRKYPSQSQIIIASSLACLIFISWCSVWAHLGGSASLVLVYSTWLLTFLVLFAVAQLAFLDGVYRKRPGRLWTFKRRSVISFLEWIESHSTFKLIFKINPFAHTAKRPENKDSDNADFELTFLSFLIGFSIAFILDTPIDTIVKSEVGEIEFGKGLSIIDFNAWKFNQGYDFDPSKLFSLMFTGFILSFGSKFFHDLLDRLYLIKRTRAALNDPEILSKSSADEVLEFVENYKLQDLFEQRVLRYSDQNNVRGFALSKSSDGQDSLIIKAQGPIKTDLLNKIITHQQAGSKYLIPYEIVQVDKSDQPSLTSVSMLDSINNYNMNPNSLLGGQICIPVVYNNDWSKNYLLTCYHVVKHRNNSYDLFNTRKKLNEVGQNMRNIGTVVMAKRSLYYEFAVIELARAEIISTHLPNSFKNNIKTAVQPRQLSTDDNNKKVSMYSRIDQQVKTGRIKYAIDTDTFDLPNNNRLLNIMSVIHEDGTVGHINRSGDSGSLLVDDNGYPIGMVFARIPNKCTYAMSLYEIFKDFDIQLKLT